MNDVVIEMETEQGTSAEDQSIDLKKGDMCTLDRRNREIHFSRGMGMHPIRAQTSMKEKYYKDEEFEKDLKALAGRRNFTLKHYSDDGYDLEYIFE